MPVLGIEEEVLGDPGLHNRGGELDGVGGDADVAGPGTVALTVGPPP